MDVVAVEVQVRLVLERVVIVGRCQMLLLLGIDVDEFADALFFDAQHVVILRAAAFEVSRLVGVLVVGTERLPASVPVEAALCGRGLRLVALRSRVYKLVLLTVEKEVGSAHVIVLASAVVIHHLSEHLPVRPVVAQVGHRHFLPDALGRCLRGQFSAQSLDERLARLYLDDGLHVRGVFRAWRSDNLDVLDVLTAEHLQFRLVAHGAIVNEHCGLALSDDADFVAVHIDEWQTRQYIIGCAQIGQFRVSHLCNERIALHPDDVAVSRHGDFAEHLIPCHGIVLRCSLILCLCYCGHQANH